MRRFSLSHGSNGTALRLEETPAWAYLLEQAGEWIAQNLLPGHFLCCDIPDWAWETGWGKFDPELEVWEHSLGALSWRFSSWVELGFGAWRKSRDIASVPVAYDWVQQHFPDAGSPFTDGWDSDDVMESCADDVGDLQL